MPATGPRTRLEPGAEPQSTRRRDSSRSATAGRSRSRRRRQLDRVPRTLVEAMYPDGRRGSICILRPKSSRRPCSACRSARSPLRIDVPGENPAARGRGWWSFGMPCRRALSRVQGRSSMFTADWTPSGQSSLWMRRRQAECPAGGRSPSHRTSSVDRRARFRDRSRTRLGGWVHRSGRYAHDLEEVWARSSTASPPAVTLTSRSDVTTTAGRDG